MATVDIDSSKVNYGKIKVKFNDRIKSLHIVAKDFAEKETPGIRLENLAFDPNGNFIGGGDKYIMMIGRDGRPVDESSKKNYLKCVRTYVRHFCGEEEEQYISEDNLYPITDVSAVPNQMSSDSENSDTENSATDNTTSTTNESLQEYENHKLVNLLFEEEGDGESEDKDKNITIGYSVPYNIELPEESPTSFVDSIKGKMRGLFGGMLADLRNVKINVLGQSVQIGKALDWDKWREAAGLEWIDKNTVPYDIQRAFNDDDGGFPNNDVSITIMGRDPLITQLDRKGKASPNIISKIKKALNSIVITVNTRDPNYPKYTTRSIAKVLSKALGTYDNVVNTNSVSEKDVLKIDDMEGLYKHKSNYDATNVVHNIDRKKEDSPSTPSDSKKGTVLESKQDTDGKEEEGSKENELLTLVKSEEYISQVNSQVEEQKNSIISKLGDEVQAEYLTNEEVVQKLEEINDAEFLDSVKKTGENCVYSSITKDIGGKGSNVIKESGEAEEESAADVIKKTVSAQNIEPGNVERNENYRKHVNQMVDDAETVGKTASEMAQKVLKAYKNIFINTKNKFKQLKGIEPEFKMYQTTVEMEKTDESLDYQMNSGILKLLFEDGNDSPYNKMTDEERIDNINKTLIGGVLNISQWTQEDEPKDNEEKSEVDESGSSRKSKGQNNPPSKSDEDRNTPDRGTFSKMGSRRHITPYCIISETENVIEYMQHHNIGSEDVYSKMRGVLSEAKMKHNEKNDDNKNKYCAIVIKKLPLVKDGKVIVNGGNGHESINDSSCQKMLDDVMKIHNCESERIDMIHCTDQNKSTMKAKKGELLEQNLAFYNKKGDGLVPELDVWVRPFNFKEESKGEEPKQPTPPTGDTNLWLDIIQQMIDKISINNNVQVTVGNGGGNRATPKGESGGKFRFIFIMPDPITITIKDAAAAKPKPDSNPQPTEKDDKKKNGIRYDWYIIPHKRIKDMKERPQQKTHYDDGSTKTRTSNAEYKP